MRNSNPSTKFSLAESKDCARCSGLEGKTFTTPTTYMAGGIPDNKQEEVKESPLGSETLKDQFQRLVRDSNEYVFGRHFANPPIPQHLDEKIFLKNQKRYFRLKQQFEEQGLVFGNV